MWPTSNTDGDIIGDHVTLFCVEMTCHVMTPGSANANVVHRYPSADVIQELDLWPWTVDPDPGPIQVKLEPLTDWFAWISAQIRVIGGIRIFEVGGSEGQGGGHRGQKKIIAIGLSTEEN